MTKTFIFTLVVITCFTFTSVSQDTLMLMNGDMASVKVKEVNHTHKMIFYEVKKKKKTKYKSIDNTDVYTINYQDGRKEVIYKQDSTIGLNLSFDEAGQFVAGEQFAKRNYKAPWITVGSAALCLPSIYFLKFWAIAVPTAYTGLMGVTKPNMKKMDKKFPGKFKNDYFKHGFVTEARRKRIMNSIYGGLIGLAVSGLASGLIWWQVSK